MMVVWIKKHTAFLRPRDEEVCQHYKMLLRCGSKGFVSLFFGVCKANQLFEEEVFTFQSADK